MLCPTLLKMSDILILREKICGEELTTFIQENAVKAVSYYEDVTETLYLFNDIVARYRVCLAELKLALGESYQAAYEGHDQVMADIHRYGRELRTQSGELKKLARKQAADEKASERLHAAKMEKQLQQAARDRLQAAEADKTRRQQTAEENARDRLHATELEELKLQQASEKESREKEIEAKSLGVLAGLAKDALLLCL